MLLVHQIVLPRFQVNLLFHPTGPFTVFEPQDQEVGKFYVVQERRTTDFEASKLWKGRSDSVWFDLAMLFVQIAENWMINSPLARLSLSFLALNQNVTFFSIVHSTGTSLWYQVCSSSHESKPECISCYHPTEHFSNKKKTGNPPIKGNMEFRKISMNYKTVKKSVGYEALLWMRLFSFFSPFWLLAAFFARTRRTFSPSVEEFVSFINNNNLI